MRRLVASALAALLAPAALALFLAFVAAPASSAHAAGRLVSGPLLGYQTHCEVAIWLETENAREISLTYIRADLPPQATVGSTSLTTPAASSPPTETPQPVTVTLVAPSPTPAGGQPIKFILGPLEMGARYTYTVAIDGLPAPRPYPLAFRTTAQHEHRGPAPDFSFLFGSCAYFNDPPYDRPGRPYGTDVADIWSTMAASGADFMLWLGDTLYLRESDFSSASGIWYRYRTDRATPALQPFLAAMPHYATWDDHEFGPNNANGHWPLAPIARAAFEAYWPNQTFGTPRDPAALYHRFQWGDAVFLLLDNRTHRVDSTTREDLPGYPKTQYGPAQLAWLKQQLASRNEGGARRHQKLTFIATGAQFLSERTYPDSEDHHRFQAERAEILDFIRANRIGGVVFISGDVHYSEVLRRDAPLPYPLYEFTSSSLTAGAHTRELPADPGRVLAVQQNNYARIALSGSPDARLLTFTVHDATGRELARHTVPVADLAWPAETP
jgi:alkaline phosphatase D